jgi:hypothetical protein
MLWVLRTLVVVVWATALFETDLQLFVELFGVSLFVLSGLALIITTGFAVTVGRLPLRGARFVREHQALLLLYGGYWSLAWIGASYTSFLDAGSVVVIQYLWYTALAVTSFFVLLETPPRLRRRLLMATGILVVTLLSYLSLRAVVTGELLNRVVAERGTFRFGVFRDYNTFAYALLLGVLLAMLGRDRNRLPSALAGALYTVLVVVVVVFGTLAGSRRTLVIFAPIALGIPFLLLTARRPSLIPKSAAVLALILGGLWLGLSTTRVLDDSPALDPERLRGVESSVVRATGFLTGEYDDVSSRTLRWEAASELNQEYSVPEYVLGRGTRSFYSDHRFLRLDGWNDTPHNFLLSAMLEGGAVRLVVLLLFIAVWVVSLGREVPKQTFWLASFLMVATLTWILNASISGEEFFGSRHFLVILLVYAVLWHGHDREPA